MNKKVLLPILILISAAIGVMAYLNFIKPAQEVDAPTESEPMAEHEPMAPASETPVQGFGSELETTPAAPVEEVKKAAGFSIMVPVPPLDRSDEVLFKELKRFIDAKSLIRRFYRDNIINRFVASVDNMTRANLSQKTLFMKPVSGQFLPRQDMREGLVISPRNSRRYDSYLNFAERLPMDKLVTVYVHFYPLFQQAYENLGFPNRSFNDRLIEVIDHLLKTPEINAPLKLACPQVLCIYAEPELEALSSGQRLMLRTGYDNVVREKALLKRLRKELNRRMH